MAIKAPVKKRVSTKKPPTSETPSMPATSTRTDRHRWTHDGSEVLLVTCLDTDGTSYGDFKWPLTVGASVIAPDWSVTPQCGGGLHGWPWGFSLGDGKEPDWTGVWLVFGVDPSTTVDLGGKCKAPTGVVRYVGDWQGATSFVLPGQMAWVAHAADGAASATGVSGAASATGVSGAASATGGSGAASATGGSGAASATGGSGAASATGWSGAASATGVSGAASATGWSGAASATGESSSAAVTGLNGKAQAGPFGCIALAYWNASDQRQEMRCAEVGAGNGTDGKLKSGVWYHLNTDGQFAETT